MKFVGIAVALAWKRGRSDADAEKGLNASPESPPAAQVLQALQALQALQEAREQAETEAAPRFGASQPSTHALFEMRTRWRNRLKLARDSDVLPTLDSRSASAGWPRSPPALGR